MMPGARNAPSNTLPFSPRNGVTPASGQASCHAPLSAVMMTIERPHRLRLECPLMAQSRHAQCADECPPLGAKRTLTNRCFPISIYELHGLEHTATPSSDHSWYIWDWSHVGASTMGWLA